ncbi:hypothetical protein ANO11243_050520 [Dothideomycetidae sp. 11243]|nr:hypothetical protein ANO11243_050520 [fungal sp. No.11243]
MAPIFTREESVCAKLDVSGSAYSCLLPRGRRHRLLLCAPGQAWRRWAELERDLGMRRDGASRDLPSAEKKAEGKGNRREGNRAEVRNVPSRASAGYCSLPAALCPLPPAIINPPNPVTLALSGDPLGPWDLWTSSRPTSPLAHTPSTTRYPEPSPRPRPHRQPLDVNPPCVALILTGCPPGRCIAPTAQFAIRRLCFSHRACPSSLSTLARPHITLSPSSLPQSPLIRAHRRISQPTALKGTIHQQQSLVDA